MFQIIEHSSSLQTNKKRNISFSEMATHVIWVPNKVNKVSGLCMRVD